MSSIFTKIIKGEIPSYKVAETEDYYAFLDINPLSEGHTLAIPKNEVDYIFALDDKSLEGLMSFSKKVGKAIERCVDCKRIGITVIGLEVPHAHVHLIPINSIYDMDFSKERVKMSEDEMAALAGKIAKEFNSGP